MNGRYPNALKPHGDASTPEATVSITWRNSRTNRVSGK